MAIRTFIFCDICNPQGVRAVNSGFQYGRRNGDGRAWFEGDIDEASNNGWVTTAEGEHHCPRCHARNRDKSVVKKQAKARRHEPLLRYA